jgi:hypothetical protein
MKKTGSIRDLEGCLPRLDHVVSIEEMNKAIEEAVMEDRERFERESHDQIEGSRPDHSHA